MRKRRFTEAQIVGVLKELDAGRSAAELARKYGVHVNTLHTGAANTTCEAYVLSAPDAALDVR